MMRLFCCSLIFLTSTRTLAFQRFPFLSQSRLLSFRSLMDNENPAQENVDTTFFGAEYIDMKVLPHRPLGCTVEESLAGGGHVFVSKVVEGGYAEQAGIQVGDVIVGVTGIFGDFQDVRGLGIDEIKGAVASRPSHEALELRIARGASVLDNHERALVELCSSPDIEDSKVEECLLDFLKNDTDFDGIDSMTQEEDNAQLDTLHSMWAEDLPERPKIDSGVELDGLTEKNEKPKPWSSRSSPSGTWVRDPSTGKLKNLDG